jgi:hypothetical protein
MFLAANPGRRKSEVDKADIAKSYKPGENILPKPERSGERRSRRREEEDRADEEAERRQLEEARERSIRETRGTAAQVGTRLAAPASQGTSSRSRSRESREQRRRDEERRERRRRRAEAAEANLREREDATSTAATEPIVNLTSENLTAARLLPPTTSPRHPSAVEARQRERQIVPQTSLRSLMSSSESGGGTGDSLVAEQILQQIIEEGLLEGIDLHNLDPAQEDALSERVAEAYRHRHQSRSEQSSNLSPRGGARRENGRSADRNRVRERQQEAERRHHQRSHSAQGSSNSESRHSVTSEDRRPPVSRTRFQDENPASTAQRRRASENERRRTSPAPRSHRRGSEDVRNQATRSATDLPDRPRNADNPRATRSRYPSGTRRTNTEPEQIPSFSERWLRAAQPNDSTSSTGQLPNAENVTQLSPENETTTVSSAVTSSPRPRPRNAAAITDSPASSPRPMSQSISVQQPTADPPAHRSQSNLSSSSAPHPSEPLISCLHCSRPSIQYELHKHCCKCSSNICLRCYGTAPGSTVGCTPDSSTDSAPNIAAPTSTSRGQPHAFVGRKYIRFEHVDQAIPKNALHTTSKCPSYDDPSSRLQEGKFCDVCHSFANTCYWSCDTCNKGDWGFCNSCINSHHCCTHALLPLAHKSCAPRTPTLHQGPNPDSGVITLTPSNLHADVLPTANLSRSPPSTSGSSAAASTMADYIPLTFTTDCDICNYPIPPSLSRFHCPSHPSSSDAHSTSTSNSNIAVGDYDICTNCYLNLVKMRKIRTDDGPNGWRKCPQGHRMIVIGFEDAPEGQKRIVVNDLVGGHSLRDVSVAAVNGATAGRLTAGQGPAHAHGNGQWSWVEGTAGGGTKRESRASRVRAHTNTLAGSAKFPPDGGNGMRAVAGYPWFPEEGDAGAGELMFPRWAEIREVEDVNGEWWAGVYAGVQGVFPGSCVRVIS